MTLASRPHKVLDKFRVRNRAKSTGHEARRWGEQSTAQPGPTGHRGPQCASKYAGKYAWLDLGDLNGYASLLEAWRTGDEPLGMKNLLRRGETKGNP